MSIQLRFDSEAQRAPWAMFSECEEHSLCSQSACPGRRYRYVLSWPTGLDDDRVCLFVMANPSTATAEKLDPTLTRCLKWATRWGYGWMRVVNVRAWRATHPKDVPPDPRGVGDMNDDAIDTAVREAALVVCGWGKLGGERGDVALDIIRRAGKVPHALRLNLDGTPAHPLTRAKMGPDPIPFIARILREKGGWDG